MQKKPILLALFAILSFLAWRHFTTTPQTTPPTPLTPEQQVNAFLSRSVIPAKELAELCEKYPPLVTSALKRERRLLTISGRISKALVLGVESNNFAIELEGSENQKIKISSDLNRLTRWIEEPYKNNYKNIRIKFHREDNSIILLITGINKLSGNTEIINSKVIFRERETITLSADFRHIGSGWVKFDLLQLP